jgi:hypothetical protein
MQTVMIARDSSRLQAQCRGPEAGRREFARRNRLAAAGTAAMVDRRRTGDG